MSPKKESKKQPRRAEPEEEKVSRSSLKDQILAALKSRSTSDTSDYVAQLSEETKEALVQRISLQVPFNVRDGFLEKSMTTWVDAMFDQFQDYIYKFSASTAASGLRVNCERPNILQEVIAYNSWREPEKTGMLFKGWLSANSWTLIVRGSKESIACYIVPSDRTLSITRTQTVYRPYIDLRGSFDKGKVTWSLRDKPISFEQLDLITRELFIAFIAFARGERDEADVMFGGATEITYLTDGMNKIQDISPPAEDAVPDTSQKLSPGVSVPPTNEDIIDEVVRITSTKMKARQPLDRTIIQHKEEAKPQTPDPIVDVFAKARPPLDRTIIQHRPESAPQAQDPNAGIFDNVELPFDDPLEAPLKTPPRAGFGRQTLMDVPLPPNTVPPSEAQQTASSTPELQAASSNEELQAASFNEEPQAASPTQDQPPGDVSSVPHDRQPESPPASKQVTAACETLIKSIDEELSRVTKCGAAAFSAHDLDKAQRALEKTMKLKEYRQKLLALFSEWPATSDDHI